VAAFRGQLRVSEMWKFSVHTRKVFISTDALNLQMESIEKRRTPNCLSLSSISWNERATKMKAIVFAGTDSTKKHGVCDKSIAITC
jgi:hypothetical protein